jgi:acetyl-CoA carboxylase, biotin carboxylase subunit
MPPLKKVLIANRGEIAVRVIRGCHEMGIPAVAVYSDADRAALHVRSADEAVRIGPAPSRESYLRIEAIVDAAKSSGADGVHPGYGFLSENAGFAQAVVDAGLTWIGPPPSAIDAMGSKTGSRALMRDAGVPVVPGTAEPLKDLDEATRVAAEVGYPIMLKAAAGGGGKGMRRVDGPEDLASAFRAARSEALSSFSSEDVYVEKLVVRPRHVEVQVLGDRHGTVVHLFERDCSIQRRNQKVVEESPCPVLLPETRAAITEVAVKAAKAVGYESAGTCEFLLAEDQRFYFLEMNTRLQVEHPITEMVTGVDLVKAQLRIAGGERLWFRQEDLVQRGHAIEVRIYAEDPANGWAPSPGRIASLREPAGPWVRVDGGVYAGCEIPIHYDPMIAKLIAWGIDREDARRRLLRALGEYRIGGIRTSLAFFRGILEDPDFVASRIDTGFLTPERIDNAVSRPANDEVVRIAAAVAAFDDATRARPAPATKNGSAWRWSLR